MTEGELFWLIVAALASLVEGTLLETIDVLQVFPNHLKQARISVKAVLLESRRVLGCCEAFSEWLDCWFLQLIGRDLIWKGEIFFLLLLSHAGLSQLVCALFAERQLLFDLDLVLLLRYLFFLLGDSTTLFADSALIPASTFLGLTPEGIKCLLHFHQGSSSIGIHFQNTR